MRYIALEPFAIDPLRAIEDQSPEALFAMCLWGEARGSSADEKIAVASVIKNRANTDAGRFYPKLLAGMALPARIAGVVLQHAVLNSGRTIYQFSSFNPDNPETPQNEEDPNRPKLLHPDQEGPAWGECIAVCAGTLDGVFQDHTGGANHYHSYGIAAKIKGLWPEWATVTAQTAEIGRFKFYRLP